MIPSRIFLCPGQGAQAIGMAKTWYDASPEARAVIDAADARAAPALGCSLRNLMFSGPAERLNQTDASQPAIYTASAACHAALLARWGVSASESGLAAAAGLSLGEYTALHLAGCFTFEQGLDLVLLRGRAMQDAALATASGMVALIGADEHQARALCADAAQGGVLVCANFNAPGQIVLSGDAEACARAAALAGARALRATPLAVAGAFHSPLMAPAAARLAAALESTAMRPPRAPVLSNVTGLPHAGFPDQAGAYAGTSVPPAASQTPESVIASIRRRLVEQLTSPVCWAQGCSWLASAFGPGTDEAEEKGASETRGGVGRRPGVRYHELCPGKTLAGLYRRIDRAVRVESHDEPS